MNQVQSVLYHNFLNQSEIKCIKNLLLLIKIMSTKPFLNTHQKILELHPC